MHINITFVNEMFKNEYLLMKHLKIARSLKLLKESNMGNENNRTGTYMNLYKHNNIMPHMCVCKYRVR